MLKRGTEIILETYETGTITFNVSLQDGKPADLTGWVPVLVIKADREAEDTDAVLSQELAAECGRIVFDIPQTLTATEPCSLFYCLSIRKETGAAAENKLIYLAEGRLTITRGGRL